MMKIGATMYETNLGAYFTQTQTYYNDTNSTYSIELVVHSMDVLSECIGGFCPLC